MTTVEVPRAVACTALAKLRRSHRAWRSRVQFAVAAQHGPLLRRARREVSQLARLIAQIEEVVRAS